MQFLGKQVHFAGTISGKLPSLDFYLHNYHVVSVRNPHVQNKKGFA